MCIKVKDNHKVSKLYQKNNKNIQTLKTNRSQNLEIQMFRREDRAPSSPSDQGDDVIGHWVSDSKLAVLQSSSSTNNTIHRCGRG